MRLHAPSGSRTFVAAPWAPSHCAAWPCWKRKTGAERRYEGARCTPEGDRHVRHARCTQTSASDASASTYTLNPKPMNPRGAHPHALPEVRGICRCGAAFMLIKCLLSFAHACSQLLSSDSVDVALSEYLVLMSRADGAGGATGLPAFWGPAPLEPLAAVTKSCSIFELA